MKRIDIVTMYEILATPFPLHSTDVARLKCCTRNTALAYMKKVQNHAASRGQRVSPKYITRAQLLEYEGWDYDEIKREALDRLAVQK